MTKKFLLIALCSFFIGVNEGNAFTMYCVNCSDRFMQALERVTNLEQLKQLYLDYGESVQQTAHQLKNVQQNVEMITDMIHNTTALPRNLVREGYNELTRLAQITNSINTIKSDIMGLEKIFDEKYKTQEELNRIANFPNELVSERNITIRANMKIMNERIDEATKATFQLSGSQLKELEDSGQLEAHINALMESDGRNGILMAANKLAQEQIKETRQLRELIATTVQSNLATQVRDEKEKQLSDEVDKRITDIYKDPPLKDFPSLY